MRDADKQYLADHYYDFLLMALKLLQNEDEARDAVQEAMASTMAMPWVQDVHRYCCRALRNCCWDRLKENYTVANLPDTLQDESRDPNLERRIELLNKYKGQLPKEAIEVLDLRFGRDMKLDEIAKETGMSKGWVKKQLEKSLRKLKKNIINEESKEYRI